VSQNPPKYRRSNGSRFQTSDRRDGGSRKPEGVDKTVYWMDLCMLIIGGKERSENEFSALLDSAGLKLVKIWRGKVGSQTVIECRLK
jgi:hypothetical protein